jgi:hypothetical protein
MQRLRRIRKGSQALEDGSNQQTYGLLEKTARGYSRGGVVYAREGGLIPTMPGMAGILTSSEGKEIRARLISVSDKTATILRLSDNQEFTVPLSRFDEATRRAITSGIGGGGRGVQHPLDQMSEEGALGFADRPTGERLKVPDFLKDLATRRFTDNTGRSSRAGRILEVGPDGVIMESLAGSNAGQSGFVPYDRLSARDRSLAYDLYESAKRRQSLTRKTDEYRLEQRVAGLLPGGYSRDLLSAVNPSMTDGEIRAKAAEIDRNRVETNRKEMEDFRRKREDERSQEFGEKVVGLRPGATSRFGLNYKLAQRYRDQFKATGLPEDQYRNWLDKTYPGLKGEQREIAIQFPNMETPDGAILPNALGVAAETRAVVSDTRSKASDDRYRDRALAARDARGETFDRRAGSERREDAKARGQAAAQQRAQDRYNRLKERLGEDRAKQRMLDDNYRLDGGNWIRESKGGGGGGDDLQQRLLDKYAKEYRESESKLTPAEWAEENKPGLAQDEASLKAFTDIFAKEEGDRRAKKEATRQQRAQQTAQEQAYEKEWREKVQKGIDNPDPDIYTIAHSILKHIIPDDKNIPFGLTATEAANTPDYTPDQIQKYTQMALDSYAYNLMKEAGEPFPKSIGLGTKFKEDLVYQLNRKYSKALLDKWTETQREAERGIRRAGDIQTVTGMTSNIELPDTLDTMEQVRQRTAQYFDSVNLNNMDSIKNFSNQLAALSAQYGIPYDVNTGDGAQNVVARQMLTEFPFDPAKHASTYWNGLQQATNPGLRADLERKIEAAKEEWAFTVQKASRSIGGSRADALWSALQQPNSFAKGGVVYANQGMLVPYQPKGTDTVPAMLTPGEFVINRQATQKHLPLLKAINNGASPTGYSSGGIAYLRNGGLAGREEEEERRKERREALEDSRTFRSGLSAAKLGPMGTRAVMEIVQTPQNFESINPQAINEGLDGSALADKISATTDSLETDIKKQGYLLNEASKFNSRASYLYRIATNSQKVLDDDRGSIEKTIGEIIRNEELNIPSESTGMGLTLKDILTRQVESAKKEWEAIKSASDILKQKYLGMVPQNQRLNQTSDAGLTVGPAPITASKGMLIPYQPKGTDTVPAMLTPGEFVVNRAATQANLPLLKAINNGAQGYNVGGIAYRSNGGPVQYFSDGTTQGPVQAVSTQFTNSLESATRALTNFGVVVEQLKNAFNQNKNPPTSQNQQNSSGGVNIDMKGISQFTTRLQSLILQLENLSQIPTEIKMIGTHRVDVNILGAEAFQNLDPAIADLIKGEINNAIAQYNQQTFYV